jgi:hypothetical protein
MGNPVFYLKINTNTDFGVKCFGHWVEIVEAFGADYYVVCDKPELAERVSRAGTKDHKFITTSAEAKNLVSGIVTSFWLNAGAALFTPFIHAEENALKCFFNIDADDTVMCCSAEKCAKALKNAQLYADGTDVNCFGLDMHGSAFERFYECWTFGITYVKMNAPYKSMLLRYAELRDKGVVQSDYLFDENLDEVFSILGKMALLKTEYFYVDNMYFRHQNWAMHFCADGVFKYVEISQFTKTLWNLKDHEIENGIPIPKRFVKIVAGVTREQSLRFLSGSEILNKFIGNIHIDIDEDLLKKKGETKLVLFGAGKDGKRILTALRRHECGIAYFCDNSEKIWGTEILGVPVISPLQLKEFCKRKKLSVVITSSQYYREIRDALAELGIKALNDGLDEPVIKS